MDTDTMTRPCDWNGHVATDPPEYCPPDDDDWYDQMRAAYLPDTEPPF